MKDRTEKFLEKLGKKLFKMELLDAVAKRKSRIVRKLQPKVMVELKSVMSKKHWRKKIKQLVQSFSFAAARSALVCLRGSRTLFANRNFRRNVGDFDAPTDLVAAGL